MDRWCTKFIWKRWMLLTRGGCTWNKGKSITATSNPGVCSSSLLSPWSRLWGDYNSSAADDAVQATSCAAAFITFINAFNSAECCSAVENPALLPLIKNRQFACFCPWTATDNAVCWHLSLLWARKTGKWQRRFFKSEKGFNQHWYCKCVTWQEGASGNPLHHSNRGSDRTLQHVCLHPACLFVFLSIGLQQNISSA